MEMEIEMDAARQVQQRNRHCAIDTAQQTPRAIVSIAYRHRAMEPRDGHYAIQTRVPQAKLTSRDAPAAYNSLFESSLSCLVHISSAPSNTRITSVIIQREGRIQNPAFYFWLTYYVLF